MMEIHLRQAYSFLQTGRRANQEDARFPDADVPPAASRVFIVCDGVGGLDKGEVASGIVATTLGSGLAAFDGSRQFGTGLFAQAMERVYKALDSYADSHGSTGMATTMTMVLFHSGGVFAAHIGDSRIYHVRPGVGILYQSDDHSLVNLMVHSGNMTPEEAIGHPQSNVITRCIRSVGRGERRDDITTCQIDDVEEGDYFFLCTDGVLHCLDDASLYGILSSQQTDREKMSAIARLCANSSDNNTACLVPVGEVVCDCQEEDEGGDEAAQGHDTQPILGDRLGGRAVDVAARRSRGVRERLSNLFNKLF